MKNIRGFLSENFQFLEVNYSIYLNRCVFVMKCLFLGYVYHTNLNIKLLIYMSFLVKMSRHVVVLFFTCNFGQLCYSH